jgi:hypothetical protein
VRSATQTQLAVVIGFAVGLCIGPISMFAINARNMLRSNEEWPEWSSRYLLALLATSVPAAVNGAIGAGVASRTGNWNRWPVTILPAALHLIVGVGALVIEPQSFMGFQWYTLVFTSVIWSAGRIGQRMGRGLAGTQTEHDSFPGRHSSPAPPSQLSLVVRRLGLPHDLGRRHKSSIF